MKNLLKKLFSPIVVCNVLALLIFGTALWFGSQMWMDDFTRHGEKIEVPDLKGLTAADAADVLSSLQLRCLVVDSAYDKHKPARCVLDQKPAAGKRVKSGRQIYLTVNKSAMDKQPLPSIIGNCTVQQAEELLRKNGFILGGTETVPGDKDMVLGVKCQGLGVRNGQLVSPDKPLVLVVGGNSMEEDYGGIDELMDDYQDFDLDDEEEIIL